MRVLFCKIACPSHVCFCKPSSSICTPGPGPGPLRLESAPPTQVTEGESAAQVNAKQSNGDQNCLKSSIKRAAPDRNGAREVEKKSRRVQWVDVIGKQLAEVREFDSSEREDADSGFHSSRTCLCAIL